MFEVRDRAEGTFAIRIGPQRRLDFRAHSDVDDQDGDVTQRTSTGSQIGERLVTRSIDDEQTRYLEVEFTVLHSFGVT